MQATTHKDEIEETEHVDKTLFCSGFPMDIQYREVRNFFRFLPGFQFSVLNLKGRTPTAFASFEDNESALRAIEQLRGLVYDEDSTPNFIIRAEMAKSNIKKPSTTTIRKPYGTFGTKHSNEEQSRRMYDDRSSYPPLVGPPLVGPPLAGAPPFMVPPSPYSEPYPKSEAPFSQPYRNAHESRHTHHNRESHYKRGPPDSRHLNEPPQSRYRSNPPMARYDSSSRRFANSHITTLFIGNLGAFATEEEVRDLFAYQPGFRRLKANVKNNRLVAFVNFSDRSSAVRAFETLQGTTLRSSDNGGIKIEFAKTNMGERSESGSRNRDNRGDRGNHDDNKSIPISNSHEYQNQNSNECLQSSQ